MRANIWNYLPGLRGIDVAVDGEMDSDDAAADRNAAKVDNPPKWGNKFLPEFLVWRRRRGKNRIDCSRIDVPCLTESKPR